ncbi:YgaP family membrane protein [Oceanicella actignis]|uniref:Inner membrane protein YgaP-like transmembrane domain-containing protein n=1 Tax=Oceanicella actignis TaxID=1189325 RepID=A0A1M7S8L7_9RHOB|nr:DUF2892 domain-containing protein [Oceanicella actignis]TYO91666.1 Protein of unknown function (DUF2892) [Oceanicella actignis]SET33052.1 Protein of unknown function [Oceanicella actignis]SHN54642.1 Protein of unknown function [Oceanicella actignis]
MTRNVGTIDRAIRALIGLAALWLAFASDWAPAREGAGFWLAAIVGVVMLATAAVSMCPLYRILGIRTCKEC